LKLLDEGRVFGVESKVSYRQIRITGGEMRGLIVRLRVGADKEDALNEKKKN
jgi:hypothetical protein